MVEVVAPDEVFAVYRAFRSEGEGDGVAVVGVLRGGEVRGYGWGAFGVACGGLSVKCINLFGDLKYARAR